MKMAKDVAEAYSYGRIGTTVKTASKKDAECVLIMARFEEKGGLWFKDGVAAFVTGSGWLQFSDYGG